MSSPPLRKLPLDLEEEILVRVPPRCLVRFRYVCKRWNALFNDKRFVNKQLSFGRPEFLLKTPSHMYSISVDLNNNDDPPTIKVSDLCVDLCDRRFYHLYGTCDGHFFIYDFHEGGVVSNLLLLMRQSKRITPDGISCGKGMGYDGSSRPEMRYKIIGNMTSYCQGKVTDTYSVFHFATNAWEGTNDTSLRKKTELIGEACGNSRVSLNGNLYWTAHTYPETGQYFIQMLDFSKEVKKTFCSLPCKGELSDTHTRILSVYKGDRFSVLEQSKETGEIRIWVTNNKIGNGDDGGDHVVWIKFMTVSVPNFPILSSNNSTSYYVDSNPHGKSFFLCCPTKNNEQACIYIVRGDLCKEVKIDQVACEFQSSVYVPSQFDHHSLRDFP